jgi:gliding motility-associated-like protein
VSDLRFSIFNRWGDLVFFTKDPSKCWDGTFKGVEQPSSVFVYQVSGKTNCGNVFRKGTVVLIR